MAVYHRQLECFMIFAATTQSVLPGVGGLKYLRIGGIPRHVNDGTGFREAIQKISLKVEPIRTKLSSQVPPDYIAPNIMPKLLTTFRGLLHEHHTFPGGTRVIGTGHAHDRIMELFLDQTGRIPELYAKLLLLGGLRQAHPRTQLTMLDQVVGRALHVHLRPFIQTCRGDLEQTPNLDTIRDCQLWCENLKLYTRGVIRQIVKQLCPQMIDFVGNFLNRCLLIADDAKKTNFAYFPTGNTVGAQLAFYILIMSGEYTNETESITIEKALDDTVTADGSGEDDKTPGKSSDESPSTDKQRLLAALEEINKYYGSVEGAGGGESKQGADTSTPPMQNKDLGTYVLEIPEPLKKELNDKLEKADRVSEELKKKLKNADSVSVEDLIKLAQPELELNEALPSGFDTKLEEAFRETLGQLRTDIDKINDEDTNGTSDRVLRSGIAQQDPSGESKPNGLALVDALMLHFTTLKI